MLSLGNGPDAVCPCKSHPVFPAAEYTDIVDHIHVIKEIKICLRIQQCGYGRIDPIQCMDVLTALVSSGAQVIFCNMVFIQLIMNKALRSIIVQFEHDEMA